MTHPTIPSPSANPGPKPASGLWGSVAILTAALAAGPTVAESQSTARTTWNWFPERASVPVLPAGAREPVSKATLI